VSNPADAGVVEAIGLLARREVSSRELVDSCLARIRERDGTHSYDGDGGSINAWVRVYEDDARAASERADARLAAGDSPPLCGVPVGLKDLYAAAGKPLTASSRLLDELPERSCEAWARLEAAGMVLLGHLHTHEFAAGGTTDQVGNPWAFERSAGGSSGGSAAALTARMTPAATGTDTAGSLRIPSALCGTSTIKPTRGLVPTRGVVPLAPTFDHAGPMARSVEDCEWLLAALAGLRPPLERAPLRRIAVSARLGLVELDADVGDGFDAALAACRSLGAELVEPPPPDVRLELGLTFLDLVCTEMLVYHRRFDDRRELYRPSIRGFVEYAERGALAAEHYIAAQVRRTEETARWRDWFAEHRIDALLEPTVPIVARPRGHGYDEAFTDVAEISLTHYWNWTGFPVAALPSGIGRRSGLPVGVSLVGTAGADWDVLAAGAALQARLGTVALSRRSGVASSDGDALSRL
jgi:aspartyl-tRNA(Asn)/glutamyl-tRNA(Gln) amidotransferase subunit A